MTQVLLLQISLKILTTKTTKKLTTILWQAMEMAARTSTTRVMTKTNQTQINTTINLTTATIRLIWKRLTLMTVGHNKSLHISLNSTKQKIRVAMISMVDQSQVSIRIMRIRVLLQAIC